MPRSIYSITVVLLGGVCLRDDMLAAEVLQASNVVSLRDSMANNHP